MPDRSHSSYPLLKLVSFMKAALSMKQMSLQIFTFQKAAVKAVSRERLIHSNYIVPITNPKLANSRIFKALNIQTRNHRFDEGR
jgi:hypothetical protein